ncbi:MAG: DUF4340 domain-containing protein [Verrucomicrobia bacterium]|nr:DUF4340 domain-containing protein [Verrucomicrobiota bacterium]
MKLKPLFTVVLILVASALGVRWLRRPPPLPAEDARVGQMLVAPSAAEHLRKIEITDQGRTVRLERTGEGSWTVASYEGLPADFGKLSQFVSVLTGAKVRRLVTSRPDRIERLGFGSSRIELTGEKESVRIDLGKTADAGGRFVRYGDEKKGYLVDYSGWLDAESKNWADKTLLALKPEEIRGLSLSFAEGPGIEVTREAKDKPWVATGLPEGKVLDASKVDALVRDFGTLQWTDTYDPAGPEAKEAKAHARTLVLRTFAGATYTLVLSQRPEVKAEKPVAGAAGKPAVTPASSRPAGPAFVAIQVSDVKNPLNARMARRAFATNSWTFDRLPAKRDEFWRAPPAPAK